MNGLWSGDICGECEFLSGEMGELNGVGSARRKYGNVGFGV